MLTGNKLSKREGVFFLVLYIGYIIAQVMLNGNLA